MKTSINIGIVGLGIVGEACKFGFEKNGHRVYGFDTDPEKGCADADSWVSMRDNADIIYVCVPTPSRDDGSCETAIVHETILNLVSEGYNGIIAIKSTVNPGTTELIRGMHCRKTGREDFQGEIIFVPEFLRERCAITDFTELNRVLVVGCHSSYAYELVIKCHGDFPMECMQVTPTQAELIKYYNNCFGAVRVTLANEFYELCDSFGEEYTPVKRGMLKAGNLPDQYFDVNDNCRGWSSICWNKDLPAILDTAKFRNVDMPIVKKTVKANKKYRATPFKDTRESYE